MEDAYGTCKESGPADKVKRKKSENEQFDSSNGTILYFVPGRIQKKRLEIMKNGARSSGFDVAVCYSEAVTHIVSEFEEEEQVIRFLKMNTEDWSSKSRPEIVNTKWFADCIKQKKILPIETWHRLKVLQTKQTIKIAEDNQCHQSYACQRASPLNHHNHRFTDILELLSEAADLKNDSRNAGRALAFRKAAAALKSLSCEITSIAEVQNLKDIGKHSLNVIKDILERNCCEEALEITSSEWFKTVKLFSGIYGVGPATANKWYNLGLRNLDDIKTSSLNWRKNKRVTFGLAFYKDLATPILEKEAGKIFNVIEKEAKDILPEVILYLTGGFRRGKSEGHDVDILLSHPVEGKEIGLLTDLLARLKEMGHVLHGGIEKPSGREQSSYNTMDNFEKCFMIYRDYIQDNGPETKESFTENPDADALFEIATAERHWIARRVDLVVCPFSELMFALVGWTGNKHFNRSLREYARKEKNMRLTSHSLYDFNQNKYLSVSTEGELFCHLGLPYRDPYYRNP